MYISTSQANLWKSRKNKFLYYSHKHKSSLRTVYTGDFCHGNSVQFLSHQVASSFKHVRDPCDIAATNRTEKSHLVCTCNFEVVTIARQKLHRVTATKIVYMNGPLVIKIGLFDSLVSPDKPAIKFFKARHINNI